MIADFIIRAFTTQRRCSVPLDAQILSTAHHSGVSVNLAPHRLHMPEPLLSGRLTFMSISISDTQGSDKKCNDSITSVGRCAVMSWWWGVYTPLVTLSLGAG